MAVDAAAKQIEMALTYYDLRRYPESEAALRKALMIEPGNARAHAWLAFALEAQSSRANPQPERLKEALREAKAAVSADPGAVQGYNALGWVSLALHKPDDALRAGAEFLRLDPASGQRATAGAVAAHPGPERLPRAARSRVEWFDHGQCDPDGDGQ